MEKYICPVCGYPELTDPPYDAYQCPSFDICPCCGCEFGYHDATPQAKEYHRRKWVKSGGSWSEPKLKPANWDLREQLRFIGIDIDELE
jgi:hypothetical protein